MLNTLKGFYLITNKSSRTLKPNKEYEAFQFLDINGQPTFIIIGEDNEFTTATMDQCKFSRYEENSYVPESDNTILFDAIRELELEVQQLKEKVFDESNKPEIKRVRTGKRTTKS